MSKSTPTQHPIDLGILQVRFMEAKKSHTANEKALQRALEAHREGKKALEEARSALEAGSAAILD